MKIVVTVMVRDEIDIIAPMIEHHVAQGVDLIIATDNGSVDGTAEVLQDYADLGVIELHRDPVHRKQQHAVVTEMARRARTEHAADWVVNADADEFWAPVDKTMTLRDALEHTPLALNAFPVKVVNLVGPPALRGAGFDRLRWRDKRTNEQLQAIGIYAQPTDNVVHRGTPDVVVAQGNHYVNIHSNGEPDPAHQLEVFHLPWRSWSQFEQKVVKAGRAYEASPDLRPSKNHHGMADYRRYQGGRLFEAYMLRQPLDDEMRAAEAAGWMVPESWLSEHLHGLCESALRPDLLKAALDTSDDQPLSPEEHRAAAELGKRFMALEQERDEALRLAEQNHLKARRIAKERDSARKELRKLRPHQNPTEQPEPSAGAKRAPSKGRTAASRPRRVYRRLRRVARRVIRTSARRPARS